MPRVLITGCSSGFGLETARLFLANDWNVVATMRHPQPALLPASDRLQVLELDVTDHSAISRLGEAAGEVDVLVNNAGVGMMGAVEGVPMDKVRELFETNVFGVIPMTKAILPQMRARRAGVIVNVSSIVTSAPPHMLSAYTASKSAVDAFTRSLTHEIKPHGLRTHLILPGRAPETSFGANAKARMGMEIPEGYELQFKEFFASMQATGGPVTHASDVAEAVWQAVADPSSPLSIPAGADALAIAEGA